MMRLVQRPVIRPQRCALIPLMTGSNEPTGFFDFGTDLDLEHVYVSVTAFKAMAAHPQINYVPRATLHREMQALAARAVEAETRRDEAERKLAEAEKALEAVETLKRAGYAQARKPGRPKKAAEQPEAVAA